MGEISFSSMDDHLVGEILLLAMKALHIVGYEEGCWPGCAYYLTEKEYDFLYRFEQSLIKDGYLTKEISNRAL